MDARSERNLFCMTTWPVSVRLIVTLFVCLIGLGYLSALGNMFYQHSGADGRKGLTLDDLRAAFHGLTVEPSTMPADTPVGAASDPSADHSAASPAHGGGADQSRSASAEGLPSETPDSRMGEMTQPGGKMRKHLAEGGVEAIRTIEAWLAHGAPEAQFKHEGLVQPGDPSPMDVLSAQCLDCHNAETGERAESPFGPDLFSIEYEMVFKFAGPGTAKGTGFAATDDADHAEHENADGHTEAEDEAREDGAASGGSSHSHKSKRRAPRTIGPAKISHLLLVTHIHMLSIPVFTLIVSGLFLMGSGAWRRCVGPVPMIALVVDFSCWWLARQSEVFIYVMVTAGGVYGLAMGIQLVTVLVSLWRFEKPSTKG